MKHQVARSEIKNIHGRQMVSSKTHHVSNYKSNAKSTPHISMKLRSNQHAKDMDQHNILSMAQKESLKKSIGAV